MSRTTERYVMAVGVAAIMVSLSALLALAGEWGSAGACLTMLAIYEVAVLGDTSP